ncbi:MAG: pentapeptide repeat-containing protein [Methylocella sp.]
MSNYLFSKIGSFWSATFFGGANFINATFFRQAPFRGAAFSGEADFSDAAFCGGADFSCATFSCSADFRRATFSLSANFEGATFYQRADFSGRTFSQRADFSRTTFSAEARFESATFSAPTNFNGATFSDVAEFVSATFSRGAIFENATFNYAIFKSATFSDGAMFANSTFQSLSLFVNAEMKGMTSFENATFETEPPLFSGAKLHQGTVWRGITWPPPPKNTVEAGRFLDAYACLKLEMNRLQRQEDELDFFALELQSRVLIGRWEWGLPIALYGLLSDYGRSYLRPLVALFVVAAIGAGAFWYFDARTYREALGLSAANTLNVFGFRRDFGLAIDTPFAWLKVFAAGQTILGTILLFLFGLGVRNKFRMK